MLDLNKIFNFYYGWWKNIDKFILFLILFLFSLSLFFSLVSTSIIASDKLNTNTYYFFIKHLLFIILGVFILITFSAIDKKKLFQVSKYLFLIFFIFLALVPFIGLEVKGSTRWINLPLIPRFQPIEILKPFLIVIIATVFTLNNQKHLYFKYLFSFFIIFPVILFLISQPDLGQTILIVLTWFSLIFVSGINLLFFLGLFVLTFSILFYLIFYVSKFEYIKNRLFSFIDPNSGNNYQSERASEAISNGGFFGQGIGEGTLNSKVPEAHTDYIISVISEEFGVIIVLAIMIIFLILSYNILKKINNESDDKVKLILVGIASIILFQTFIHIGVNVRLLPTTGMTLPFLSYGGSSIVSTSVLSGIILNLTKRKISQ
jgi:cell division protein FtsW